MEDDTMPDADKLPTPQQDWAEHERVYRGFVKGVLLFSTHVLVILLLLAWVFSDSLSTPSVTG
jgi:hypothetical protein